MEQINDRGAKIKFLTADFSQEKFTPLLKKPLLSSGKINVSGPLMRWDTNKPEPTVMRIGEKEVELYYPKQKVVEIYPVDERLGSLAASPLPRLDVLKRFFRFEEITGESSSEKLALKLAPIDESLAKHIDSVQVLLDVQQGYILRAEMLDADGDRTVITFSNISTGTRPPDDSLKIELPPDVKITRPLEGLHGQQPSSQPH
jgi:outer membrane lipoprotein-sorting protein